MAEEFEARQECLPLTDLPDAELERGPLERAERVYGALRASYEARKDYFEASEYYFAQMEMRRKRGSVVAQFLSLTGLYGILSGYGERWARALIYFVVVVAACAGFYMWDGLWIRTPVLFQGAMSASQTAESVDQTPTRMSVLYERTPADLSAFGPALLHSFLVATLIGRGENALPVNLHGYFVQTLESILGPLFLGLAALAIRRRFQR